MRFLQSEARGVVYTCLTGNYDTLREHKYLNKNWDYVCFTDDEKLLAQKRQGIWEIRPLVYAEKDNALNNRYHKINPHKLFPEYEQSVYVDGNVDIRSPYLFRQIEKRKTNLLLPRHFCRNCVYEEFAEVEKLGYDKSEILKKQFDILKKAGFPEHYGLGENNILYRRHNEPALVRVMEDWWYFLENYSRRDQLSFVYVLWKNGFDIKSHLIKNARRPSKDFALFPHNLRLLITGGAGFIGSSTADRMLEKGYKVTVIDNFNDYYDPAVKERNVAPNLKRDGYRLYRGDICDRAFLEKVFSENKFDAVLHFAARAGVRPSLEQPEEYVKTNIEGTVNILEAMRRYKVMKLVFASSSSVYGNSKARKFSEKLNVSQPISPYAATKLADEQLVYTYSKLFGISAVCLRFFTVFGPRQRPDLAIHKFIRLIENNERIPLYGNGKTKRDYTYIGDIVDGVEAALAYSRRSYDIFNLGGGSPVTLIQMVRTIEKVLGKKASVEFLPMQPGDVNKTAANISKAKKFLKYKPKVSFETGIRNFVEWKKKIDSINLELRQ